MSFEELYKLKIAALLRYPPHRLFVIEKENDESNRFIRDLFGDGEIVKLVEDNRIRLADETVSKSEKWMLGDVQPENNSEISGTHDTIKISNIVAQSIKKEIPRNIFLNKENAYNQLIEKLRKILHAQADWRLKYHLLYLLFEPLWILEGLPVGPIDLRTPTYTVFDHNYSVTSIINWVFSDSERFQGLLVGLDVSGIQDFIMSSRKVRDVWISSYIVSALTWYTIIEIIDRFGPDTLLIPSTRMNVFYSYWIREKYIKNTQKGLDDLENYLSNAEKLFYLSDIAYEMYKDLGIPPYPIIPGRATLVLPSGEDLSEVLGIDDLGRYLIDRFHKGWELLWEATRRYVKQRVKREKDLLWGFIDRVFDYFDTKFKDARFSEIPPLGLRVETVEVKSNRTDRLWLLYDRKYHELVSKLGSAKYMREKSEAGLNIYDITEKSFDNEALGFPKVSTKGFEYCTTCGSIPAMVVLPGKTQEERGDPRDDEYGLLLYCTVVEKIDHGKCNKLIETRGEEFERLVDGYKSWLIEQGGKDQLKYIKSIFSPGERLCPWCFLKRVLSIEPRLLKVLLIGDNELENIIEEISNKKQRKTWFPSLSHISSTRLYENIANLSNLEFIKLIERIANVYPHPALAQSVTWTWYFLKKIKRKIDDKISELVEMGVSGSDKEFYEAMAKTLIQANPEDLWFDPENRHNWINILGRDTDGLSKWLWRYYALVRADGDSIGDLLEGRITAFIPGIDDEVYSKALLEEKKLDKTFRKWIEKLITGNNANSGGTRNLIDNTLDSIRKTLGVPRNIVSPSYHVAISAALTRTAMIDIAMISMLDGVVVYAGGDDLMAFSPVDTALNIVFNTRRGFAGAPAFNLDPAYSGYSIRLEDGFLKINNAYLPLLPSVGRSYSIYIAHYHSPLSTVIRRSFELLEMIKEKYDLTSINPTSNQPVERTRKDVLAVAYNPRASIEEHSIIPLTWRRPILSSGDLQSVAHLVLYVDRIVKLVDDRFEGKLSRNMLYDVRDPLFNKTLTQLFREAKEPNEIQHISELVSKLMQSIIERNAKSGFEAKMLSAELLSLFKESIPLISMFREKGNKSVVLPVLLEAIDAARLIESGMR